MTRARDLAAFVSNADGDIKFDTDTLFIDSSANRVGIKDTTPDNVFNIKESALSGRGASNGNTSMTLEHATDTGIQFFSATQTQLRFGDAASTGSGSLIYTHSDDVLKFSTAGSERLRIDDEGLKFHGDTAAVNALNDYEEGTFTPSIGSGAGSGGAATSATGSYTKIGNTVFASCHMSINTLGSMSGTFFVTGFPFAAASGYTLSQGAVRSQGISGANHQPVTFEMVAGSANGRFHFSSGTNAQLLVAVTQFTAGDFFALAITYNV